MNQKHIATITITAVIAICLTILGVTYNLRNTGISIKNTGNTSGSIQNSISVSGEGKVTASPDIVRIQAGISEIAPTTKKAQTAANEKIKTILSTLEQYDINKKDIQTTNLSFYPEYDWQPSGRKLLGQKVQQTLNVIIRNINGKPDRVTNILDALGEVNGLELNSVQFDIDDRTELFTKARKEAFSKAKQKAEELAGLGEVKLLPPITISENTINYQPPMVRNFAMAEGGMGGGGDSSLPSGELEITATISVVFGIE